MNNDLLKNTETKSRRLSRLSPPAKGCLLIGSILVVGVGMTFALSRLGTQTTEIGVITEVTRVPPQLVLCDQDNRQRTYVIGDDVIESDEDLSHLQLHASEEWPVAVKMENNVVSEIVDTESEAIFDC